ncbi:hypothetical protein [Lonsdalea quercina]|uniref:hypothetical protein n=1 Tax=Lonsdalea quercina TaxID=71657 RepID=UPI0039758F88
MDIKEQNVEQLLAGTFTSEFTEITLTQQINDNPKVFTGTGYLYYKKIYLISNFYILKSILKLKQLLLIVILVMETLLKKNISFH